MNESSSTVKPATPSDPKTESTESNEITSKIIDAIKTCYDPEIPVNIYELGLIYNIDVSPEGSVDIKMTLTSPACPAAGTLPPEVESKVAMVEEVTSAKVEVVWEPTWTPDKMTEGAKLELGMF